MPTAWAADQPAQGSQPEPSASQPAPGETTASGEAPASGAPVERVVVTGSRLRKSEFTSSSPIQVITSEESTLEGLADTADILQNSTVASGSFQTNNYFGGLVTGGGPGVNTISLRGLGDNRTIVLVNGRRLAPAGARGQVGAPDLNTLPESMIERFEILKDGGSSVYGSDAVAGAINVITRSNYDGAAISSHANMSFEGGGDSYQIDGVWGETFNRGQITAAGEWYKLEALRYGDRDYLKCAQDYAIDISGRSTAGIGSVLDTIDPATGKPQCQNIFVNVIAREAGGTFVPDGTALLGGGIGGLDINGFHRVGTGWGRLARTNIGGPGVPALPVEDQYALMSPAKRAAVEAAWRQSAAELDQNDPRFLSGTVLSPVERFSGYVQGSFDLFSNVQLYTEMLATRRKSEQEAWRQFFPTVVAGHFGNPFDAASGIVSNAIPLLILPANDSQEVDYFRGVWGARGEIGSSVPVVGGWSYDLYAQFSRSDAAYSGDFIYDDRVNAVTLNPALACDPSLITISAPAPSCPTIDWSDPDVVFGRLTPEQSAFLLGNETGKTRYDQILYNGSITGDLFTLPAGALSAAAGFEIRTDKLDDRPGAMAQANNYWSQTTSGRTKGEDSVREVFGELSVPLLAQSFLAESLTIDLSGRYTDYDSYGDGSVYKAGVNWQITPEYRVRATQGTSFRAPALFEIFLADQTGFQSARSIDPCVDWNLSSDQRIRDACGPGGLGLPEDFPGGSSDSLIRTGGGGVGVLEAETSDSKTLGFIWTPDWINFSAAIDYWKIKIDNEVSQLGAGNIVFFCLTRPPVLANGYCALVDRDTDPLSPNFGQIASVDDAYVNIATQVAQGLDLHTRFTHEFSFGRLLLESDMTWTFRQWTDTLGDGNRFDVNGAVYAPDYVANLTARFDYQDWTFNWHTELAGKASDNELIGGDIGLYGSTPFEAKSKQYTEFSATHDMSVRYRASDWEVVAGIQNVFDEPPPFVSAVDGRVGNSAVYGSYDIIGRRGFLTVTKDF